MALRWLLVLSVLAFGNYAFVKSIEGASVEIEIDVNTDQGSRHDSVALIKEDDEWKALKDKNREASQRMFVTNPFTGKFIIPGIGRNLVPEVSDDEIAGIELNVNVNGEPVNVPEITADEVPINIENDLQINESVAGKEHSSEAKTKIKDVRLPTHLKPLAYNLSLIPFIIPGNFTIKGSVVISLKAIESGSNNITIHSIATNISHESVNVNEFSSPGNEKLGTIDIVGHEFDEDREFYILKLGKKIEKGNHYQISIDFVSELNDELRGFYRSTYKDKDGNEEIMASTQFQATDARRAFPCLDEPELKAKFSLSLGRTKDMKSVSNMPIKKKGQTMKGTDEYVWDHYEQSVPMSTYLVAMAISKFKYQLAEPAENNVTFRIWGRESAHDQLSYAASVGPKMLQFFESYFNVTFPLPKQDMMAIPDFSQGAMENWGLILYGESYLLYKDGISTVRDKNRIAEVISHELAHQWFGNLVTPRWWTDLWLNEGFATYVSYLGVEAVEPNLRFLDHFNTPFESLLSTRGMHNVLKLDSLGTSHPISIPVQHPDEIGQIFDKISYIKGASVVRMMSHFLTEKTFRAGLKNYLTEFSFKAADQDDLWRHLTSQAHVDKTLPEDVTVKEIMDTWTLQMGFPVITVTRNYDDRTAKLTQERFLVTSPLESDTHDYKWWVPITFAAAGDNFNETFPKVWMKENEKEKNVKELPNEDEAVIFNIQQTGYYRVNYDEKNWRLIINQLNEDYTKINVINRAQLINDALNLASIGLLNYDLALGVTSYLDKETEYFPWYAALNGLEYVGDMLEETASYGNFKRYMRAMIDKLYDQLGYKMPADENHLNILLRNLVVKWACKLDHPECLMETNFQYSEWMKMSNPDHENRIDTNMKDVVYCSAIGNGDEAEWDFGWERYKNSKVASEKELLLNALSCTKKTWLLKRYLDKCISEDSEIRKASAPYVISKISENIVGKHLAFRFVRDNWITVFARYEKALKLKPIMDVMQNRNTESSLEEMKYFKEKYEKDLSTVTRIVDQMIQKTEKNIVWMEKYYEEISKWLSE